SPGRAGRRDSPSPSASPSKKARRAAAGRAVSQPSPLPAVLPAEDLDVVPEVQVIGIDLEEIRASGDRPRIEEEVDARQAPDPGEAVALVGEGQARLRIDARLPARLGA